MSYAPYIRAAGSLLSGISGFMGNKGPGLGEQYQEKQLDDKYTSKNRPSWLVEGARRAGIHPLAAMGMAPSNSPALSIPSDDGRALNRMGRAVQGAADAWIQKDINKEILKQEKIKTKRMQHEHWLATDPNAHVLARQSFNSQQDAYETRIHTPDNRPTIDSTDSTDNPVVLDKQRVTVGTHRVIQAGKYGKLVSTPWGVMPYANTEISGQASEDILGEGPGTFANIGNALVAKQRLDNMVKESKRILPDARVFGRKGTSYIDHKRQANIEKQRKKLIKHWQLRFIKEGYDPWVKRK